MDTNTSTAPAILTLQQSRPSPESQYTHETMMGTARYLHLREHSANADVDSYICLQMRQRKPHHHQSRSTKRCLLYSDQFCEMHNCGGLPHVRKINHQMYGGRSKHRQRYAPMQSSGIWASEYREVRSTRVRMLLLAKIMTVMRAQGNEVRRA